MSEAHRPRYILLYIIVYNIILYYGVIIIIPLSSISSKSRTKKRGKKVQRKKILNLHYGLIFDT